MQQKYSLPVSVLCANETSSSQARLVYLSSLYSQKNNSIHTHNPMTLNISNAQEQGKKPVLITPELPLLTTPPYI